MNTHISYDSKYYTVSLFTYFRFSIRFNIFKCCWKI